MNNLNLLTIIAEEALASFIEKEIVAMGAKGYTSSSVSGKGLHNVRDNQWEGENIKIETIVSEENCKRILGHLQKKYFDRYAMIAFYHPVNVIRTNHFV
jgi:nitrogen regulatory protein P-II 2